MILEMFFTKGNFFHPLKIMVVLKTSSVKFDNKLHEHQKIVAFFDVNK